jgi:hypothetical protein
MRPIHRLLAKAESVGVKSLLNSKSRNTLLPPIQLYRRILRAHRKLPQKHRVLGDLYVKSEFHAHKEVDNPIHIVSRLCRKLPLQLTVIRLVF